MDERFLADPVEEEGTMRAVPAEDVEDGSLEIVDMVKVFEDGTMIYLVAEGSVKDLRIASVDYFDYNGTFNENAVRWSCSRLKDAAVQLLTVIPDGMPNLKISWRDAGGEQIRYLSQSGEDGSLLLVDESIEAVG